MLSDAILSLGAESYSVMTPANGAATIDGNGRSIAPTPTTPFTVKALILPLNGREIELLPEGLRGKEIRAMFTTAVLAVPSGAGGESGAANTGSIVTIGGESWVVRGRQGWPGYNRYLLMRVDP